MVGNYHAYKAEDPVRRRTFSKAMAFRSSGVFAAGAILGRLLRWQRFEVWRFYSR